MRVGIIEDEIPSRQVIKNILKDYCPYTEVVAEEGSVGRAIEVLNEKQPEIVFLDIELRGGNGFDVLKDLIYSPQVIFTTAYSQYAINAIKVHAFDYLLKPINEQELAATVEKCRNLLEAASRQKEKADNDISFFSFSSLEGTHVIRYADILYFESSGAYTYCITTTGRTLISKNLGEVEREIEDPSFFRTHHGFIVNVSKIVRMELKRSGKVFLEQGHVVPVAQRKIKEFKTLIKDESESEEEE